MDQHRVEKVYKIRVSNLLCSKLFLLAHLILSFDPYDDQLVNLGLSRFQGRKIRSQ